jgi:hypothetical protein
MCIAEYYNIYMEINGFMFRCARMLVFSKVVECLYMGISEL